MNIERILEAVNKIAPESLQEGWDNSGIQINDEADKDVKRIMTCLEISDTVIDEAIERGVDMIITHHPFLFSKINKVDIKSVTGNQIVRLIKNGISVYSSHTAFDSAAYGTNEDLARQLGLSNVEPMIPADIPGCGMGRFGVYEAPEAFGDFFKKLKSVCSESKIRVAGKTPENVKKVALCTGAGSEFIDMAKENGADVYITGDVKYHDARHADDIDFCVIDAGHYGTEILFGSNMAAQLQKELGHDVEIIVSETDINPFS